MFEQVYEEKQLVPYSENIANLQSFISQWKKDFSSQDACDCWNKSRRFGFRTDSDYCFFYDANGYMSSSRYYFFSPLRSKFEREELLLKCGFYSRYFGFRLNWSENDFYKKMLDDFFTQYVINGENNYGYYIYGDIGVGKSTLLSAIAKILITFLRIEVRYITMPRLVKLITGISEADKNKVSDLESCDILFVDDLAHESMTTNTQESYVRDFFAYRYGNELLNIIAGNNDIRTIKSPNSFERQMSDYIDDSKYYKDIKLSGKSKRN
jgi:hypothetical protein